MQSEQQLQILTTDCENNDEVDFYEKNEYNDYYQNNLRKSSTQESVLNKINYKNPFHKEYDTKTQAIEQK